MQHMIQRIWRVAIRNKVRAASRNQRLSNSIADGGTEVRTEVLGTPRVPLILGYAGTIPFLGSALVAAFAGHPEDAATVTQIYGGSILSFLGGTHWGLALTQASVVKTVGLIVSPGRDFVISVVPSLVGFGSMMVPPIAGLPVLATSFASMWLYDRLRLPLLTSVPSWYVALRTPLSIAATGACLVSWFAVRRITDFEPPAQLTAISADLVERITPDHVAVVPETPVTPTHATPETVAAEIEADLESQEHKMVETNSTEETKALE